MIQEYKKVTGILGGQSLEKVADRFSFPKDTYQKDNIKIIS